MARLAELGFESFMEEDQFLLAYLPVSLYNDDFQDEVKALVKQSGIEEQHSLIGDKNWNEEWEKNYAPVTISGKCHIRAPFHSARPGMQYEIIIEPKMAFGTAHHETTQLVAGWLMDLDVIWREVLDMGCGTGILAILANKMGARFVIGIDNDEWAWRNASDNFRINDVIAGEVILGDAKNIEPGRYDLILANINRNILVQDMVAYGSGLQPGGYLLVSGFYVSDREAIEMASHEADFTFMGLRTLNNWAAMLFRKSEA